MSEQPHLRIVPVNQAQAKSYVFKREERDAGEALMFRVRSLERQVDEYRGALDRLVQLKDGPRDAAYREAKDAAWDQARSLLAPETKSPSTSSEES